MKGCCLDQAGCCASMVSAVGICSFEFGIERFEEFCGSCKMVDRRYANKSKRRSI